MYHLFGGLWIDIVVGFTAGLIVGVVFYIATRDPNPGVPPEPSGSSVISQLVPAQQILAPPENGLVPL